MNNYKSNEQNRIISTPSAYAKEHYLYVQETGTLKSMEPHVSKRKHLQSLLFFIVKKGKGRLTLNGKTYVIQAGNCIFLNCVDEYSHESSKEDPWELTWVHFYGKDAAEMYRHLIDQKNNFIFTPCNTIPFQELLKHLYEETLLQQSFYEQKCHKLLTDLFTLCYCEGAETTNEPLEGETNKIGLVKKYLDENYSLENISLNQLSEDFYISKFHLSREFKKVTGVTIINYLNSKRINEAKRLLRFSNQSVRNIAVNCGIPDENYFTKVFFKYESMTPTDFRKKWQ